MEILYILTGGILFAAGYVTCFFTSQKKIEPQEGIVKRVKTSLRNPLRTYEVHYEPYKGKGNLYQPVKPKRQAAVNEVEHG